MKKSGAKIITAAVIAVIIMVVGIADMINASSAKSKPGIFLFAAGLTILVLLAVIYILINKKPFSAPQKASKSPQEAPKNKVVHIKSRHKIHMSTPAKPVSAVPEPPQQSAAAPEDLFGSIDSRSLEKKEEPQPKSETETKPEPVAPQPVTEKEMSGLNTDDLDLDGLEDLDKPAVSSHAPVISSAGDMNGVDSSGLDTDSLGSYAVDTDADEESGSEYYSNDDYYTVDAVPSDIKLSEMDE